MPRVGGHSSSEWPYPEIYFVNSDNTNGVRVFPYEMDWTTNNTVVACLNQCAAFGYPAAGLEYGEQCCEYSFPLLMFAWVTWRQSVVTFPM
jgi:hypothetical protein